MQKKNRLQIRQRINPSLKSDAIKVGRTIRTYLPTALIYSNMVFTKLSTLLSTLLIKGFERLIEINDEVILKIQRQDKTAFVPHERSFRQLLLDRVNPRGFAAIVPDGPHLHIVVRTMPAPTSHPNAKRKVVNELTPRSTRNKSLVIYCTYITVDL